MRTVRILRNYKYPDLLRQTPGGQGNWNGYQFIMDEGGLCDFVFILNGVKQPVIVQCPSPTCVGIIARTANGIQ